MRLHSIIIVFATLLLLPLAGQSQGVEIDEEGFETFMYNDGDTTWTMKKYYFCLLKEGPDRSHPKAEVAEIQKGHLAHLAELGRTGKICMSGPFGEHENFRGIVVFNTTTKEEAETLMAADPSVKAGRLAYEIVGWWAAKGTILE